MSLSRELGIYLLNEVQDSIFLQKYNRILPKVRMVTPEDEDYLRFTAMSQGMENPTDLVPYVRNKIRSHKRIVERMIRDDDTISPDDRQDGIKMLETLTKLSDVTDKEIVEALELARPTLAEIIKEFEQARFS